MVKINIHSIIDLITNSSTEIFVHSDNCVKPVKELLDEFLRLEGSNKKCDDLFDIFLEHKYYKDNLTYCLKVENFSLEKIQEIFDILNNKLKKPEWWFENKVENIVNYHSQSFLVVKSKDKKYEYLLNLLNKFLYSPYYYEYSSE